MHEVDWTTPIVALVVGLVVGLILTWLSRDTADEAAKRAGRDGRLEDLRRDKDRLLQALRDLEDTDSQDAGERAELELQAAGVLRGIDELENEGKVGKVGKRAKGGKGGKGGAEPAPASTPAPVGGMSSELKGMLKGGGVVAFAALLGWLVVTGSRDRAEGDSITGGDSIQSTGTVRTRVPGEGEVGGAADVPPDLRPQVSEDVDRARAKVSSDPDTIDNWIELGYALVEAEGWIDAYQVAEEVEKRAPGHPEGMVLMGIVRVAMGMVQQADVLFDEALAAQPGHLVALSYKGMIAYRSGDPAGARAAWTTAREAATTDDDRRMFDELLSMPDPSPGAPGAPGAGQTPPGHPPAGGSPPSAGQGARIEGTISLAEGATPPAGGSIFVIARVPGAAGGPPAATRKLLTRDLPTTFSLDDGNVMMGGPFPAEVELSARFDADGNAMTRSADDLVGSAGVVKSGASGVQIVLAPAE